MSMFASRTTDTIPIPFEPGHTATIRGLTGGEADAAQAAHLRSSIGGRFWAHGWAASFQQQLAKGIATYADAAKLLTDPLNGYDRLTMVKAGLLSYTVPEPALTPETRDAVIADLGDDALEYFAREILRRTKPALFLTAEDAKAAEKELSAPASVA